MTLWQKSLANEQISVKVINYSYQYGWFQLSALLMICQPSHYTVCLSIYTLIISNLQAKSGCQCDQVQCIVSCNSTHNQNFTPFFKIIFTIFVSQLHQFCKCKIQHVYCLICTQVQVHSYVCYMLQASWRFNICRTSTQQHRLLYYMYQIHLFCNTFNSCIIPRVEV